MADKEQVERLKSGVEEWNRWREAEGSVMIVDLILAVLSGADLSRADLSGAVLSGADLSRADLSRADLSGANLRGANLRGADLIRADLSRADLRGADLTGARGLIQGQIDLTTGNKDTKLPEGLTMPQRWLENSGDSTK